MKITLLFFLMVVSCLQCFSQQQSQYTQYMYNTLTINPGYAGSRGIPSVFGLYRTQWVGLDGAPNTANFSIESPVTESGQGVGFSIIYDEIGPSSETMLTASYSYPIQLSADLTMSFGVSGSLEFMKVDFNQLEVYDPDDPLLSGVLTMTSPNVGAGVYFRTEKWYVGVSVPQFLETKFYDDVKVSVASQQMHFYGMAGYVFDISDNTKFKPAAMIKVIKGTPIAVDVSANFLFMDKLTLGAAYRWDATFSGLAGFQISPGLNIGYAYDYDITDIGNYNSGSHEIFIRFDIFATTKYRLVSPRFF